MSGASKGGLVSSYGLSPAAPMGRWKAPTDKTRVVSMRRRVPTNWVSGRTLQTSTEPVIANLSVPSDFIVEGQVSGLRTMHPLIVEVQVSGLRTMHPLITLKFISTWSDVVT